MSTSLTPENIRALRGEMKRAATNQPTLEDAAQKALDVFYDRSSDALVLVRMFISVPFGRAPANVREFLFQPARKYPFKEGELASLLSDSSKIMAMLGTRGALPDWNDRHKSKSLVSFPLLPETVRMYPMFHGMLKSCGIGVNQSGAFVENAKASSFTGLYYVGEASVETDSEGRKKIPGQQFVAEQGVRTVLGLGGSYLSSNAVFIMSCFFREHIDEALAQQFVPIASAFTAATARLAADGPFFRGD